jgi:hypothetical protein
MGKNQVKHIIMKIITDPAKMRIMLVCGNKILKRTCYSLIGPIANFFGIESYKNNWYGTAEDFSDIVITKTKEELGKKLPELAKDTFLFGMEHAFDFSTAMLTSIFPPAGTAVKYFSKLILGATGEAAALAAEVIVYESNLSGCIAEIYTTGQNPCVVIGTIVIGSSFVVTNYSKGTFANLESIKNKFISLSSSNKKITFEQLSNYINTCNIETSKSLRVLIDKRIDNILITNHQKLLKNGTTGTTSSKLIDDQTGGDIYEF